MDFDPNEDQRIALDAFRRFVEGEIAPAVQPWHDATIPKDLAHALLRKLAFHGVGSGWLGESDGGLALDLLTSGLLYEELARVSPERRSSTRASRSRSQRSEIRSRRSAGCRGSFPGSRSAAQRSPSRESARTCGTCGPEPCERATNDA